MYNLQNLIQMAEQEANTIVVSSGVSKCSMSLVYNVNGKRISFSKELTGRLGLASEVYLLPVLESKTLLVSAKPLSDKSSVGSVSGSGKKICYSARLCKALVDMFSLDYSEVTSLTFRNVTFDVHEDIPVAIIDMVPTKN